MKYHRLASHAEKMKIFQLKKIYKINPLNCYLCFICMGLGKHFSNLILSNRTVYSLNAPNTKIMQAMTHASMAVKPSALGELVWIVLKMLTKTRNIVTRRVIRPGMTSKTIFFNLMLGILFYVLIKSLNYLD